jgi:hypothetical protein
MADERKVSARKIPLEQGASPKAPRPASCRTYARKRLAKAMPELMDALVEHSAKGSLGHMKLVVQITGLDEPEPGAKQQPERDVAAELLEEWTGETNRSG